MKKYRLQGHEGWPTPPSALLSWRAASCASCFRSSWILISFLLTFFPPAGNSKQALRCKTCKIAAHLWCTSELSQQACHGKVRHTLLECNVAHQMPAGRDVLLLYLVKGQLQAERDFFLFKNLTFFSFQKALHPKPSLTHNFCHRCRREVNVKRCFWPTS